MSRSLTITILDRKRTRDLGRVGLVPGDLEWLSTELSMLTEYFMHDRIRTSRFTPGLLATVFLCATFACDEGDEHAEHGDDDYEAPSSCKPLLDPLVGSYPVTGVTEGDHARQSVLVFADAAIDFDEGRSFEGRDIVVCYDRTMQDHDRRVQVSYGADDDGPVVNLYVTAALVVESVEFRHRNENESIRVDVGPAQPLP